MTDVDAICPDGYSNVNAIINKQFRTEFIRDNSNLSGKSQQIPDRQVSLPKLYCRNTTAERKTNCAL